MTRGFDDQILSNLRKQNYVTKTKLEKYDDNNVNHLSLLMLKISFLTLIGCLVKMPPDTKHIYG